MVLYRQLVSGCLRLKRTVVVILYNNKYLDDTLNNHHFL